VLDAPSTFEEARSAVDGIDGWLSDDQARRLWDRARALAPGATVVEIGSFRGRSTVLTALALPPDTQVIAIDPHGGNDRGPQEFEGKASEAEVDHHVFLENLDRAGVRERVTYVREFSHVAHDAVDGDVDLLYIDGAHRFVPARADVVSWGARVRPGGTMLIHDSFSCLGVTMAIFAVLTGSPEWQYEGRSGSMAQYRRVRLAPAERRRSTLDQVAQLPWFFTNLLMKVLLLARLRPVARALGFPEDKAWPY
jgi:hypothetical protein